MTAHKHKHKHARKHNNARTDASENKFQRAHTTPPQQIDVPPLRQVSGARQQTTLLYLHTQPPRSCPDKNGLNEQQKPMQDHLGIDEVNSEMDPSKQVCLRCCQGQGFNHSLPSGAGLEDLVDFEDLDMHMRSCLSQNSAERCTGAKACTRQFPLVVNWADFSHVYVT